MLPDKNIQTKLPQYPYFKPIGIEDKGIIDRFTANYPPYCDFVFSNLYMWRNTHNSNQYSFLNNNLVIKTLSNRGTRYVISLLGENDIDETILELIKDYQGLDYIPQVVIEKMTKKTKPFVYIEDENNSDYIYSLEKASTLIGSDMLKKRSNINRFRKKYPSVEIDLIDLKNPQILESIYTLYDKWLKDKSNDISFNTSLKYEYDSFRRYIEIQNLLDTIDIGFFDNSNLIGFSINECTKPDWVLSHFVKADINYKQLFSFMFHEVSKELYPDYKYHCSISH